MTWRGAIATTDRDAWSTDGLVPGSAKGRVALVFDGVPFPVVFHDCPEVIDCLGRVLHGWPVRRLPEKIEGPRIDILPDRSGYRTDVSWLDETLEEASAASTVCSLVVDLVQALVAEDSNLLCLHCGAARIDGRLVVFTGPSRAGKSTLVARLAAAGITIFSDDLLLIAAPEDHGRSLGVRGRLRLPLPKGAADVFRHFVERNAGPRDERYLYLDTPAFVPFGERAPIGAVVLLDRRPGAAARFLPAGRAESLRHLVRRNLARGEAAGVIMNRLHRLMMKATCVRLLYSDLEDAVKLITEAFSQWPAGGVLAAQCHPADCNLRDDMPARRRKTAAIERHKVYRRNPKVTMRDVDGELFLASAQDDAIWHLNPLGAGVWNLLADPVSAVQVARMLSIAFQDSDPAAIQRDVDVLFAGFIQSGLIIEAGID